VLDPICFPVRSIEAHKREGRGFYVGNPGDKTGISLRTVSHEETVALLDSIRSEARNRFYGAFPTAPELIHPMPDFNSLVSDPVLQIALRFRWTEADKDYQAGAYLSTIIMLGSILEAVLLSIAKDRRAVAGRATSAPKVRSKVPQVEDWKLADLINVARECGWMGGAGKDFAPVLRDYRNYIHPNKQAEDNPTFNVELADTCWAVLKLIHTGLS